jgi:ketosteroid isomerase-like protein
VSQENVEIVRRALEAWQRDDLDTWLSSTDRTIEWHTALGRLVEGAESAYRGHEGMRRFWHIYPTELESFAVEAEQLRDVGDDRVVLLGKFRWRGRASGIESELLQRSDSGLFGSEN